MMNQTYVTDITHYLNETGELAEMPGPALIVGTTA